MQSLVVQKGTYKSYRRKKQTHFLTGCIFTGIVSISTRIHVSKQKKTAVLKFISLCPMQNEGLFNESWAAANALLNLHIVVTIYTSFSGDPHAYRRIFQPAHIVTMQVHVKDTPMPDSRTKAMSGKSFQISSDTYKYRHSSISAVSISVIFDLTWFTILSYFPLLQYFQVTLIYTVIASVVFILFPHINSVRSSTCALTGFFWLLRHVIYLKLTKVLKECFLSQTE